MNGEEIRVQKKKRRERSMKEANIFCVSILDV